MLLTCIYMLQGTLREATYLVMPWGAPFGHGRQRRPAHKLPSGLFDRQQRILWR